MGVLTAAVHVVAAAELVERKKDESLIGFVGSRKYRCVWKFGNMFGNVFSLAIFQTHFQTHRTHRNTFPNTFPNISNT